MARELVVRLFNHCILVAEKDGAELLCIDNIDSYEVKDKRTEKK